MGSDKEEKEWLQRENERLKLERRAQDEQRWDKLERDNKEQLRLLNGIKTTGEKSQTEIRACQSEVVRIHARLKDGDHTMDSHSTRLAHLEESEKKRKERDRFWRKVWNWAVGAGTAIGTALGISWLSDHIPWFKKH